MLIRNKVNILIGLLVLTFLGVIYGLFFSRPEMVVDSSLRVAEVSNPELDRIANMSSRVRANKLDDQVTIDSVGDSNGVITRQGGDALVSEMQDSLSNDGVDRFAISPFNSSSDADSDLLPVDDSHNTSSTVIPSEMITPSVLKSRAQDRDEVYKGVSEQEPLMNFSGSDVELLSDSDGFVDLNLAEEEIESVLLEGYEFIIDDLNEVMSQIKSPTEDGFIDIEDNSVQPVTGKILQMSDLVVLPETDELLAGGTDKVSRDYQAAYKRLKLVTEKLINANDENSSLKRQFDEVANENRKMAQMIRDIDEKIKALVSNN